MAIPYSCENCGYRGKAADKLAGRRVKCKQCQAVLRIPTSDDNVEYGEALPVEGDLEAILTTSALDETPSPPPAVRAAMEALDADELIASASDEPLINSHVRERAAELTDDVPSPGPDAQPFDRGDNEESSVYGPAPPAAEGPRGPRTSATLEPVGLFAATVDREERAAGLGTPPKGFGRANAGDGPKKMIPGANERLCPKCREVISKKARLCRHCGFDLNFEHLLTNEKVNIDVNQEREQARAAVEKKAKRPPRRSYVRILGTLAVLVGFVLPWLTGIGHPPQDLSGAAIAMTLLGQRDAPTATLPRVQDDSAEIEGGTDEASVPHRPDSQRAGADVPSVLADAVSSARWLTLAALLALPAFALIGLIWEAARGGVSIVLGILALAAGAMVVTFLGPAFAVVGIGLYVSAAGGVLMLVPPLGRRAAAEDSGE